jgi:acyl-CoA hydrolase
MVTVSIDKCYFEKPSKEGQLIKIFGRPAELGTSSVTLYIEARAHNVRTGKQYVVLKTNMKFVYIDEEGLAIPLGEKARLRIQGLLENNVTKKVMETVGK